MALDQYQLKTDRFLFYVDRWRDQLDGIRIERIEQIRTDFFLSNSLYLFRLIFRKRVLTSYEKNPYKSVQSVSKPKKDRLSDPHAYVFHFGRQAR